MTLARGDVVLVRFPHTSGGRGKKRPVVVVQADTYNQTLRHVVVAEVTSKTLSVFGAAMWRAVDEPTASLDLMAGARLWSVETSIDPVGGALGGADFSSSETWVDPVLGAKGRVQLPSNFYLTGWGMVGGFGVSSKARWDVMGAVGYEVTEATSFIAGYRALGVDYRDGDFLFDVVQSGPILGALVLRVLEEVARHFVGGAGYQVVYGAVIILFIVALPKGLVGGLSQLLRKRARSPAPVPQAGAAP